MALPALSRTAFPSPTSSRFLQSLPSPSALNQSVASIFEQQQQQHPALSPSYRDAGPRPVERSSSTSRWISALQSTMLGPYARPAQTIQLIRLRSERLFQRIATAEDPDPHRIVAYFSNVLGPALLPAIQRTADLLRRTGEKAVQWGRDVPTLASLTLCVGLHGLSLGRLGSLGTAAQTGALLALLGPARSLLSRLRRDGRSFQPASPVQQPTPTSGRTEAATCPPWLRIADVGALAFLAPLALRNGPALLASAARAVCLSFPGHIGTVLLRVARGAVLLSVRPWPHARGTPRAVRVGGVPLLLAGAGLVGIGALWDLVFYKSEGAKPKSTLAEDRAQDIQPDLSGSYQLIDTAVDVGAGDDDDDDGIYAQQAPAISSDDPLPSPVTSLSSSSSGQTVTPSSYILVSRRDGSLQAGPSRLPGAPPVTAADTRRHRRGGHEEGHHRRRLQYEQEQRADPVGTQPISSEADTRSRGAASPLVRLWLQTLEARQQP